MSKKTQKYCKNCKQNVLAEKQSLSGGIHVVHALISLFSCGVWLLVWLIHAIIASGGYRCTRCGSRC